VPVGAVGDADGFFLLFVNDFFEGDGGREDVHEDFAGNEGDDAGALVGSPEKDELGGIHGENMAGDAGDAVFIGIHHADEMAVGFLLGMTAVNDVNLFAFLQNHAGILFQMVGKASFCWLVGGEGVRDDG
jgi:hypothetical protein